MLYINYVETSKRILYNNIVIRCKLYVYINHFIYAWKKGKKLIFLSGHTIPSVKTVLYYYYTYIIHYHDHLLRAYNIYTILVYIIIRDNTIYMLYILYWRDVFDHILTMYYKYIVVYTAEIAGSSLHGSILFGANNAVARLCEQELRNYIIIIVLKV